MYTITYTGLPDPFAKISVGNSGQVYSTNAVKATLDPKWNTHYDLYLTKGDGITIRYDLYILCHNYISTLIIA